MFFLTDCFWPQLNFFQQLLTFSTLEYFPTNYFSPKLNFFLQLLTFSTLEVFTTNCFSHKLNFFQQLLTFSTFFLQTISQWEILTWAELLLTRALESPPPALGVDAGKDFNEFNLHIV